MGVKQHSENCSPSHSGVKVTTRKGAGRANFDFDFAQLPAKLQCGINEKYRAARGEGVRIVT